MQDTLFKTLINLNNVYRYEKGVPILKDVNLEVKKGQIYTYMGSVGSGKTTTINIILGLMKPSSGTVQLLGVDPYSDSNDVMKVRKKVGAVLKKNGLSLNLTGMENLIYWAKLYGLNDKKAWDNALSVLKKVKLSKWANTKVSEYSHGKKLRLALARAMINDPYLLVLDEPLTALDTKNKLIIKNLLNKLVKRGKGIFISTTDWNDVQRSYSKFSLVTKGKMIFEGTLEDFINSNGHKKVFCHMNSAKNAKIKAKRIKKFCMGVKTKGCVLSFVPKNYYKPNLKDKNIVSSWTLKNSLNNNLIYDPLDNLEIKDD